MITGFGAFYRVLRFIGEPNFKHLFYTGELIGSKESKRIGLVQNISDDIDAEIEDIVKNFNTKMSYNAFIKSKNIFNKLRNTERESILELENENISRCFFHEDKNEGMDAFLQKRDPNFL